MSEHLALFHVADLNILLFVQTRDYVLILRKLGLWVIELHSIHFVYSIQYKVSLLIPKLFCFF